MNYFGLVFSFMFPGFLLGLLAAGAWREFTHERRQKRRTSPIISTHRKLYIETLK